MKLKQSSLTVAAAVAFALMSVCLVGGVLLARSAFHKVERSAERRAELRQLGIDQADSSKFLTSKVREFTVTTRQAPLDAYWNEVDVRKTQARVLARLKALHTPSSELDLLALSHKNSAGLVTTETRAMRLVLEAKGVAPSAMPPAVAAFRLPAVDAALPADAKVRRARQLVHDDAYQAEVKKIMAPVDRFQRRMHARTEADFTSAQASARRATTVLLVLTAVLALGMAAVLMLFHTQVGQVISRYSRALRGRDPENFDFRLTPAGTVELHDLADRMNDQFLDQEALRDNKRLIADTARLVERVTQAAATVSGASQQVASVSEEAGRAVGEIAHAVGEVAVGAQEQVQAVEATQQLTEQMAHRTKAGATNAQESTRAAEHARDLAAEGAAAVQRASAAMAAVRSASSDATTAIRELGTKSEEIGGIVDAITGIAGQTNLLALNAAIEAARAGEQGRGFAVVAEEVRKLAEESQQAAASIGALIAEIQRETSRVVEVVEVGARETQEGVDTVDQARVSFEQIADSVADVGERVREIAAAIDELASSSEQVRGNVAEVARVAEQSSASAEQVSASTEQTSASTQEIAASAQDLASTAAELQQLVAGFKLTA